MEPQTRTATGLPVLAPESLAKWLKVLFASYRTPLSQEAQQGYTVGLADLTQHELDIAFEESLRRHKSSFPPTPAEVRGYLDAALQRMPPRGSVAKQNCKKCGGSGWRMVDGKNGSRYAVECECWRKG